MSTRTKKNHQAEKVRQTSQLTRILQCPKDHRLHPLLCILDGISSELILHTIQTRLMILQRIFPERMLVKKLFCTLNTHRDFRRKSIFKRLVSDGAGFRIAFLKAPLFLDFWLKIFALRTITCRRYTSGALPGTM